MVRGMRGNMGVRDVGDKCDVCVVCSSNRFIGVSRLQCADINKAEGRKLSIEPNQVDPLECRSSHTHTRRGQHL